MVNKRVKTKLIHEDGNIAKNPQPGTVLDHTITNGDLFDFFLVTVSTR